MMMPYLCLFVFWSGALLLFSSRPRGLKMLAGRYSAAASEGVKIRIRELSLRLKRSFSKDTLSRETAECLGYIKNISIPGRSSEMSSVSLMSELSDISAALRPVFAEMSRYMELNDKKAAEDVFVKATGLETSRGIAALLTGWDELPPKEVKETVAAFLSALSEERITARRKKNELISDLIYFPVVLDCMLILLDFVYVSFFARQTESLFLLF